MRWKTFVVIVGLVVTGLAGCAPQQPQTAASACPVYYRSDLSPKWLTCADGNATVKWPANKGFAAQPAPATQTLVLGDVIDRFGRESGSFFSPKGESFDARSVPYVCRQMDYRIYQVRKPLTVKAGKATPWFDEPGGAEQYETTEPASKLLADGYLVTVTTQLAGSTPPGPQCGPL